MKIVAIYRCWKCQHTGSTLYKVGKDIYACEMHKDDKEVKATSRDAFETKVNFK